MSPNKLALKVCLCFCVKKKILYFNSYSNQLKELSFALLLLELRKFFTSYGTSTHILQNLFSFSWPKLTFQTLVLHLYCTPEACFSLLILINIKKPSFLHLLVVPREILHPVAREHILERKISMQIFDPNRYFKHYSFFLCIGDLVL